MPHLPAVGFITLIMTTGPEPQLLLTHEPYWVFSNKSDCESDAQQLQEVAIAARWTIKCVPGTAHGPKESNNR